MKPATTSTSNGRIARLETDGHERVYATTLRDLTGEFAAILYDLDAIERDEEMTGEERAAALDAAYARLAQMPGELAAKLDNCRAYDRHLEAMAAALKAEEAKLAERRRRVEARAERFEQYVVSCIRLAGGKVPGCARLQQAKNSVVKIEDDNVLPRRFWRMAEPTVDKQAIKAALKAGEEVPGARLVDGKESLRWEK